jgi:chromate transport protein ChrA
MTELLQALLLTLTATASAIWIGTARRGYGEPDQPALFCALLAFTLAAGTGACALARLALGLDTLEAQRWLQQATLMLGLPLVGVVALTLSRKWVWSRPTWGRVLLGLCVFFEMARQFGWSGPYALGLGLASAALVLYAGVLQWPARLQVGAGVLGSLLMLASMSWPGLPTLDRVLADQLLLSQALACPILAWLLLNLPGHLREPGEAPAQKVPDRR